MNKFKTHKLKKNTINNYMIVFFCVILTSLLLFNIYSRKVSKSISLLVSEQIDEVVYQIFNDLITDEIINKETVNDILEITKNNKGEILSVNYDLEKTYKILTEVTKILKNSIVLLQKGKIDVNFYNQYMKGSNNGLIVYVPLFINSKNIFINNLGPKIPVVINFSEKLLTNVKTKVTNYGFNNALLEIYITVEMQKIIVTPMLKDSKKFNYDILVSALVVNGSVPEFYGNTFENSSKILDIP